MTISAGCRSDLKISVRGVRDLEGHLCLDIDRLGRLTRLRPVEIRVVTQGHADRLYIEAFIEDVYRRSHGASVTTHYPTLLSLHGAGGDVLAAVGLRSAARGRLFLEQYLQGPVEDAIAAATGRPIGRAEIAEVGSLASLGNGASVFLVIAAATFLDTRRFSYAVVTANDAMQRIIRTFGFAHTVLGAAHGEALADGGRNWGSYYSCGPQMLAGPVAPARGLIAPYLPLELNSGPGALLAGASGPA